MAEIASPALAALTEGREGLMGHRVRTVKEWVAAKPGPLEIPVVAVALQPADLLEEKTVVSILPAKVATRFQSMMIARSRVVPAAAGAAGVPIRRAVPEAVAVVHCI